IKRRLQQMVLALFFSCSFYARAGDPPPRELHYSVVRSYVHDAARFTQGFAIRDGVLYESTGRYGLSALYAQDLRSGQLLRTRKNTPDVFAEGLAVLGPRVFQLTWRERRGYIYDRSFKPLGEFDYGTEGWGLTEDGTHLIMSDGSALLTWLDANTLQREHDVVVRDQGAPVERLNELEYVNGMVWANVWLTDRIAAIDAASGAVRGWLDLSALKKGFARPAGWDESDNVLNGIAYDPASKHFFVTGKCWPQMFELQVDAPPPAQ
ncbi:MAG TPA: glutaminyl-peptide cyclotransferase, partial [Nevskiaceae bacterium]|nr:glutaminyl-peptide cyclotransferase [Nevskiaceae bacterium]